MLGSSRNKNPVISIFNGFQSVFGRYSANSFYNNSIFALLRIKVSIIVNCFHYYLRYRKKNRNGLRGTRLIADKGNGATALVLGTGPSLGDLNWSAIARDRLNEGLVVFATNYLILQPGIPLSEIDYLVLSDEKTTPDFESDKTRKLWALLREYPQIYLLTPSSWHETSSKLNCAAGRACLHFNDNSLEWISRNISPTRPRGYASMTAYKAIAYAIHMGFDHICISGIENTWFRGLRVDERGKIFQDSIHFGENYADPLDLSNYYTNGVGDYFYDLSTMFLSLKRAFGNYNILENLDRKSIIDFIPKVGSKSFYSKYLKC